MPEQQDPIKTAKGKGTVPSVSIGIGKPGRGSIKTNLRPIKWTRKKRIFVTLALGIPYLIALISTWSIGAKLITYILLAVALLVGFLFLAVGWIDNQEF